MKNSLGDPHPDLRGVVVIPSYHELHLSKVLRSLIESYGRIDYNLEVLVVLNKGMHNEAYHGPFGEPQFKDVISMNKAIGHERLKICCVLLDDLPEKYSGVGLVRRIGMDLASQRLDDRYPIFALDGDCEVSPNYLKATVDCFQNDPSSELLHFQFAHLETLGRYIPITPVCLYELHLRYYKHALAWAGHPYSVYTVGSSFAVRAKAYRLTGGMNRRKAGEDFYFIQKYAERGTYLFYPEVCVFPSGRVSHRVPFGTGKAIEDVKQGHTQFTYHWISFEIIKDFLDHLEIWYLDHVDISVLDPRMQTFLEAESFAERWKEALRHSSSYRTFLNRFYKWFNAFRAMKCLHYLREQGLPDTPVRDALPILCKILGLECSENPVRLLQMIRVWERGRGVEANRSL